MDARALVFLPSSERKLRAPWRILIFILVWIAVTLVTAALTQAILGSAEQPASRNILYYWLDFGAILIATFVSLHWVDGNASGSGGGSGSAGGAGGAGGWNFVRLGRPALRPVSIGSGFLMGMLGIGVPCLVLLATHNLRVVTVQPGSWSGTAARTALLLLPAAAAEELLMRGYVFAVLREAVGWKTTLVATSVVFGLLHVRNPGANAETITVVVIAGFFLGTILIITESLYAACMAHFAWNWTMAAGLHTAISGLPVPAGGYHVMDSGPAWLTGGSWGPEGGVAAALGMFALLFYLYGRHNSRLRRDGRDGRDSIEVA